MQNFKNRWEINENWQLLFPFLGIIALLFSAYLLSSKILLSVMEPERSDMLFIGMVSAGTLLIFFVLLTLTLKIFEVLEKKWNVTYRWELIAIFIAFAVTGSTAAKISAPLLDFIGLDRETTTGWLYWPARILLIFPIYQILLLVVGWLFGQFRFFWNFEKKMLRRMGFGKFLD